MKKEQKSPIKREKVLLLLIIGLAIAIGVIGGMDFGKSKTEQTSSFQTTGFRP